MTRPPDCVTIISDTRPNPKKELFIRCAICDSALSEVHFNSDHNDIEPCPTCLLVVAETAASFLDKPSADEGDFGVDEILRPDDILHPDYDEDGLWGGLRA